jgi:hypothetical protein
MRFFRRSAARALPAALPLALAACATLAPPPDPQSAALADALRNEAALFHAVLAAAPAPQCQYEHNMNEYVRLDEAAFRLKLRLAATGASPALLRAADALARTIEDARASHELASARIDDPSAECMAPGAIALNADAIARASQAIADAGAGPAAGDQ